MRLRDRDAMQMALNRNRKTMGKRYIEVYKSTLNEFSNPDQRKELERKPIPAGAGPQGGMRECTRESAATGWCWRVCGRSRWPSGYGGRPGSTGGCGRAYRAD